MSHDGNPYAVSQTQEAGQLSFLQKLTAISVGSIVLVASLFTMLAFLFGVTVALAGETMAWPINFAAVINTSLGPWFIAGAVGTVPISVLLGLFSTFRVLRVQRALMNASTRRHLLKHQLDEFRQSRPSK